MMRHSAIDFSESYRCNLGKAHLICLDSLGQGGRRRENPTATVLLKCKKPKPSQKVLPAQTQRISKFIQVE